MLGDALSFPMNDDDWVKTLAIGGGIVLLAFGLNLVGVLIPLIPSLMAIVLQLPLMGYTVRVMQRSARGEETPPKFEEWDELFVDGLKVWLISFVYFIPLGILMVVFMFVGVLSFGVLDAAAGSGGGGGAGAGFGIMFILMMLVFLVLSLVVGYVVPAAVANFAVYDDLGKAFSIREILGVAFTADYFIAILIAAIVGTVIAMVAFPLMFLLVGFALLFYVQVFGYYLIGRGYAKGRAKRGNPV